MPYKFTPGGKAVFVPESVEKAITAMQGTQPANQQTSGGCDGAQAVPEGLPEPLNAENTIGWKWFHDLLSLFRPVTVNIGVVNIGTAPQPKPKAIAPANPVKRPQRRTARPAFMTSTAEKWALEDRIRANQAQYFGATRQCSGNGVDPDAANKAEVRREQEQQRNVRNVKRFLGW